MEHMSGKRILLTRASDDMSPWAERLSSLGAEGVSHPCISIERLQLAVGWLGHLDECDWVAFTSFRSVAFFAELLGAKTLAKQLIAAVGPSTEAAVQARFGRCDLIAPDGTASSLAETMKPRLTKHSRVLLPGPAEPRPELAVALNEYGAATVPLPLYATRSAARSGPKLNLKQARLDAALFASPSAVAGAVATSELPNALPVACIGPSTAKAARAAGMKEIYTSETRDLDGLLRALKKPLSKL